MKTLFLFILFLLSSILMLNAQVSDAIFIQSTNSNYDENLRLFPSTTDDYSSIVLGAAAGNSGTGIGQWTFVRYPASNNYLFGISR